MSATRTVSRWLLWISVALLASPGLAQAQDAVLYEVTETMKVAGKNSSRRDANATLMGTVSVGTPLCPAVLKAYGVEWCSIVAHGSNSIDLSSGKGPLDGKFAVVIQDTNEVDAAELVILRGRMRGHMDLSLAIFGWNGIPDDKDEMPVGALGEGTWSAEGERGGPLRGLRLEGGVQGIFRLPFRLGDSPALYWVGPGATDVVPVAPGEHSLGVPTVRLDLWFTEVYDRSRTRRGRNGGDD